MLINLTNEQAKIIKYALLNLIENKEIWEERFEDMSFDMGDETAERIFTNFFSTVKSSIEIFKDIEDINTSSYSYPDIKEFSSADNIYDDELIR
ncbi:hypothetical protein [Peptoanaerobacter stomatis]